MSTMLFRKGKQPIQEFRYKNGDPDDRTFWRREIRIITGGIGPVLVPPMPATEKYNQSLKLLINAEDYHNTMPLEYEIAAIEALIKYLSDYQQSLLNSDKKDE